MSARATGRDLRLAHLVGLSGRVSSIEAAPSTFARLNDLCRPNEWTQMEPIQAALASKHGVLTMSDSDNWVVANVFESGDVEVPAVTLDDLCAERGITRMAYEESQLVGPLNHLSIGI